MRGEWRMQAQLAPIKSPMVYDADRLRTLIRQKGLTLTMVGGLIGCNRDTMARKLDNGRLTVSELSTLVVRVPLDREEFLSVWGMEEKEKPECCEH